MSWILKDINLKNKKLLHPMFYISTIVNAFRNLKQKKSLHLESFFAILQQNRFLKVQNLIVQYNIVYIWKDKSNSQSWLQYTEASFYIQNSISVENRISQTINWQHRYLQTWRFDTQMQQNSRKLILIIAAQHA